MDAVLKDILESPRLHDYVNELQQYLLEEDSKRKAFYQNMRDDEKVEFINGEVVYHSPAKYKHTQLVENIASVLTRFVRKNNLGQVLREKALVKLRRNDFEPDVCFFRKEISDAFEPNTHNLVDNVRIRFKVTTDIEKPDVFTITNIYEAANWLERETYDFYGINFVGHPNLRRILNVEEMDYFPMRKEFPLEDQTRRDKDDEMFGRGGSNFFN
jgi:NADH:ubiquinone oxidoreductase subunit C